MGVNRVGFNEKTGKPILSGDVDFAEASKVAGKITVPGGVGPMTIAMLMKNTVRSAWSSLGAVAFEMKARGGGLFAKSSLPRTPTRKNLDWWGGGATEVPLCRFFAGRALA